MAENAAANWLSERTAKNAGAYTAYEIFTEIEKGYRAYYVFNFKPEGWVVVSADDVAFPIIAYSPNGFYSRENHPPGFDEWMDHEKKMIVSAIEAQLTGSTETATEWIRLKVEPKAFQKNIKTKAIVINPLVHTTWAQDFPYNEQTPADPLSSDGHAKTGCVATAMSQVMKYHAYPPTGWGSHSYDHSTYGTLSADFGATTYNWAAMPDSVSTSNFEIAKLNYHCGVSVEMDYGPDYSGGSIKKGMVALKNYFKYQESLYYINKNNYTDEQWKSLIKTDLNDQHPILYSGPGHAFICDGYDDVDFFHFNWGWSGLFDGYYALDALTPGGADYTNGQAAIIRIQIPTLPNITLPYFQGFETGLPDEWIFSGERVSLSTADKHSGSTSILLNDPGFSGENTNIAALKINVPDNGAVLEFWVKRGHDDATIFNQQMIQIRPQFGPDVLLEIFNGNLNDAQWQNFTVNLTPWENSVVTLYFEEKTGNITPPCRQWMYIDDVEISANEVPVSDFTADITQTCTGTVHFTDLSSFFPTSWSWSFPGGTPSSSAEQNPSIAYATSGTYTVSMTASNGLGQGSTQTKTAYLHVYNPPQVQCTPATLDLSEPSYHFGIHNVTFNTINHTTGGSVDDNGYQDFSCAQTTDLQKDMDYPVSVTVGLIGHPLNFEYVKIFIDYNNDGDFTDAGESVFSSGYNPGVHSGTIHTSSNPLMDTLLRMRVMSDAYSITNACASLTYGQAEDYGIVFRSTIPPCDFSITPNSKNFSAGSGTDSVAVDASDNSCAWTATEGLSWVTITGGASGTGDGTVTYDVAANDTCNVRIGTITIAGEAFTVTQNAAVQKGDVNGDGNLDLADAILSLKIAAGIDPGQAIFKCADVNNDGKIGIENAIYILQVTSRLK